LLENESTFRSRSTSFSFSLSHLFHLFHLFHPNPLLSTDASIWVHQFVKAMRDSRGEPMPNAHLLGFFRRACR